MRPLILFGGVVVVAIALLIVRHVHPVHRSAVTAGALPKIPYSVGISQCTFVDPSRSTKNYGTGAITPGRTLATEIRYPTVSPAAHEAESENANPARRRGPFPLVIFAHGYDLTPDTYKNLLDVWVRAGYVVAAPLFPDTNEASVDVLGKIYSPEADDANQPGDVAFVIKSVIADARTESPGCPVLHGLVAPGGAVITGQSDGAVTVDALAYAAAYRVPGTPIRAVISLSGEEYPDPDGRPTAYAATHGGPPLLVVQSATDTCNPPQNSTTLYSAIAEKDKWFLEIKNANHLPPYTGSLPAQRPAFSVVAAVTRGFIEAATGKGTFGHSFLALGNAHPGVARLSTGPTPVLPTLAMHSASCYVN